MEWRGRVMGPVFTELSQAKSLSSLLKNANYQRSRILKKYSTSSWASSGRSVTWTALWILSDPNMARRVLGKRINESTIIQVSFLSLRQMKMRGTKPTTWRGIPLAWDDERCRDRWDRKSFGPSLAHSLYEPMWGKYQTVATCSFIVFPFLQWLLLLLLLLLLLYFRS